MAGRSTEYVYGDGQALTTFPSSNYISMCENGVPEHVARAITMRAIRESLYPTQTPYEPLTTQPTYNPMTLSHPVYHMNNYMWYSMALNNLIYQTATTQSAYNTHNAANPQDNTTNPTQTMFEAQFQNPQIFNTEPTYRPMDPNLHQNTANHKSQS